MRSFKEIKHKSFISALAGVALLSVAGCGSDEPDCASRKTKDVIIRIAKENTKNSMAEYIVAHSQREKDFLLDVSKRINNATAEGFKSFVDQQVELKNELYSAMMLASHTLSDIIMTDKNESTKNIMCKSKLSVSVDGWGGAETNIVYRVERTSDGDISVEVSGLK